MRNRLIALLSSLFGGLALLLACVGLYGLLAFLVARRTNEMGVRMALGARRKDVLWLVMREALWLVCLGLAIGIPLGVAGSRVASSQVADLLFRVKATDPATFAGAACVLLGVALAAAFVPAWRAASINPVAALRQE